MYFQTYYPKYDAGWWLTGISIFGGAIGAATGGYFSDRLVNRLGIFSRAIVLGGSQVSILFNEFFFHKLVIILRLLKLFTYLQLLAAPFTFGVLFFNPPWAFISLFFGYMSGLIISICAVYHYKSPKSLKYKLIMWWSQLKYLAEMWFGVMFAILVELVPARIRSTALGIALFIINNVGGNLPIIVDPLSSLVGFRGALLILYPGALAAS